MKASEILRGYLQVRRVPLPLAGALISHVLGLSPEQQQADLDAWRARHPGQPDPPKPPEVGLLPLAPGSSGIIMERAREYARSHGLENPKEDDDLYEYGKAIHTCLLGVVDPDSNPQFPEPFFDGGLEQLLSWRELGRDGVLVLAEQHEAFTQEISGQLRRLSEDDYEAALKEVAGPEGFPFWFKLRPGTQWSFAHTTASLLITALKLRSGGGSDSELDLRSLRAQTRRATEHEPVTS